MLGCFSLCCATPKRRKNKKSGTIIQIANQIRVNGAPQSSAVKETKKKLEEEKDFKKWNKEEEQDREKVLPEGIEKNGDNGPKLVNQEESDSLFSVSLGSRSKVRAAGVDDGDEVNSSKNPLNTIENVIDLRPALRSPNKNTKSTQNFSSIAQIHPQSKQDSSTGNPNLGESRFNASLSNWLVEPAEEQKPKQASTTSDSKSNSFSNWLVDSDAPKRCRGMNSSRKKMYEDRPILGAMNTEELGQISAIVSPRKSPKWSHDDVPIIGSVGSYWNESTRSKMNSESESSCREISTATSRFKEDQLVKWNSTPFETRLERALVTGNAEI